MSDDIRNANLSGLTLEKLPPGAAITPTAPVKRIHDGEDLSHFLRSKGYVDIIAFLLQLNRAMMPEIDFENHDCSHSWPVDSREIKLSPNVEGIASIVEALDSIVDRTPPQTGPRRFGNAAFRTWYSAAQDSLPGLMKEALANAVWEHASSEAYRETLVQELLSYLLGSFGSSERLDYGTGHELSFLAFLGCIWQLGGFAEAPFGVEERGIAIGIINPYLKLVRKLILTYTLEPAGSHGVWGLDDHSFLPYVLGSAQYSPPIPPGSSPLPNVGSLNGAPTPDLVAKIDAVERYRSSNFYFSAIGFIFDVKNGPFWEHSPTLYDISGIKDGWAKINKGMVKMYNAEVLSKFPVVQHFPFGTLFSWDLHPAAPSSAASPHMSAQPSSNTVRADNPVHASVRAGTGRGDAGQRQGISSTAAPWHNVTTMPGPGASSSRFGTAPNRLPPPTSRNMSARGQSMQPPTRQVPK
ncbi:hypothetical protein AAFC00_006345 [Neodothiora populina]|uniref:Serine/threonine-protein phosphatase 2A activator n=1 Tax=Neodothiora populina TaxID=2781224 RepID=A0ABR3P554_9PEZI